jgi:hypothetical protein
MTSPHLYRVAFQFYARDPQEAMEIVNGSLQDAPKVVMTIENLDRRRMQKHILAWGIVIGLLAASFALWCIAEGWWTR